jgi:predicted nucleic acid-binding protein
VIQFDSSYLIDLHDELAQQRPGPALDLIESLDPGELLAVSVHVVAELRVGPELAKHPLRSHEALDRLLAGFLVVYPDDKFAPAYARLWAAANRLKRIVASMDLLIATAAVVHDAALVTNNVKDFSKLPGLRIIRY